LALVPGALVRWWRLLGLPVDRLDAPRWLPLWSGEPAGEALLAALGAPTRAVVVGHPRVADALEGAGVEVRRVRVEPPVGTHQATWLLGTPLTPEAAAVPLLPVVPASGGPDVLLFPGSGGLRKCWPADRYAALGHALQARGLGVAVVLGPVELDRGPGPEVFAGLSVLLAPDLAETAALCAGAAGVIGNDAGTTHLAAAVGARVLALFGPTEPVRWRPLGPRVTVLRAELDALAVDTVLGAWDGLS
jgi:ADP-heptose:LPS heptosyltransferase